MDHFMIAFVALLIMTLLARVISERAIKKLEQEKKVALIDLFSKSRIYTTSILIGVIVLFFASLRLNLIEPFIAFVLYVIYILSFISISSYRAYKKLKENDFPDSYIKSYMLSTALKFLGIVIFFALLEYWR